MDDDTLALFRESVRGLLERRWPADRALELAADGAAVGRMWDEAVAQGWVDVGGVADADAVASPVGPTAAALILVEELGRAACPLPLVDTLLVAAPARASAPAGTLVAGRAVAAGLGEAAGGDRGGGGVQVASGGQGAVAGGRVRFVEGLPTARHLLLVGEPGPQLAVVEVDAPGVTVTPTAGLAVPPLADVALDSAPALAWEVDDRVVSEMARLGRLGCSARALGAASRAFELALEHARTRQQFGSPIGRFQAIQHRLSDAAMLLDAARLLLERAARGRDQGAPGWVDDAAAATAFAGPALRRVAREVQHVLAGVGYIEEHEAPRHFRRVNADTLRFGGAPVARAELATHVLGP